MEHSLLKPELIQSVLDCANDGLYVTDTQRRILHWSPAAERITGWTAEQVVGLACHENVLCHIDQDGNQLCHTENCPLARSIATGERSDMPIIIYAMGAAGRRVPVHTSVAPLRDAAGQIIGGVETFRDATGTVEDLRRARMIQDQAMATVPNDDPRLQFRVHYQPLEIIGGDFYSIEWLSSDRYAFILADVMGHGVGSALYTMYLRNLWEELRQFKENPAAFMQALNRRLHHFVIGENAFATAVYGLVDLAQDRLALVNAGHPSPFLLRAGGAIEMFGSMGLPLGMLAEGEYETSWIDLEPGDRLLVYTDCAIEVINARKEILGEEGLLAILDAQGYPGPGFSFEGLTEALLAYSNTIRLSDDLTLLELEFRG